MGDERDLEAIIDSVYDAADDPAGLAPVLEKIGGAVGAVANHTLVIETSTNVADNHHYGADPASFLEYDRHWRPQDPRFVRAMERFGDVLSDVRVIDSREFERSAIYNEHIALADIRYTMMGNFAIAPGLILGSAFLRPKRRGPFADEEMLRMSSVVPHLKRAARLRHVISGLRSRLADLRRALDSVTSAMMVLDAKGVVVCANAAAEELLAEGEGIRSEKGRLTATRLSARAALEKAIARAALTAQSPAAAARRIDLAATVKIAREAAAPLSIALLPLRPRNEIRERASDVARVLAVVHDPSRIVRIDRALVADRHGLTPTEAELAASLAEGKTLAEFADARGSSEQTARTHLKRILDKTQTRRQADLVRLLLTGAAIDLTRLG